MTELDRIGRLERMLDKFTIAGAGINVEGDLHRGYAIGTGGAGFLFGGIPGSTVGACCTGSTCSTLTAAGCAFIGGTYLGDGTVCSPNPCPGGGGATGACCVGEDCSITTAAACASAGGTYHGDGTVCDPNPCPQPCPCNTGFEEFGTPSSPPKYYRTQTISLVGYSDSQDVGLGTECHSTVSAEKIRRYDDDCSIPCDCSGDVDENFPNQPISDCSGSPDLCLGGFDPYNPATWLIDRTAPPVIGCTMEPSCGSCCSFTLSLTSDSPTERIFDIDLNPGCGEDSVGGTIVVTLSEECTQ